MKNYKDNIVRVRLNGGETFPVNLGQDLKIKVKGYANDKQVPVSRAVDIILAKAQMKETGLSAEDLKRSRYDFLMQEVEEANNWFGIKKINIHDIIRKYLKLYFDDIQK